MLDAMVGFLGKNAMTAYLCMMGIRLTELHRVLKPTGRPVSALRPDREPLSEDIAGCDFWGGKLRQ